MEGKPWCGSCYQGSATPYSRGYSNSGSSSSYSPYGGGSATTGGGGASQRSPSYGSSSYSSPSSLQQPQQQPQGKLCYGCRNFINGEEEYMAMGAHWHRRCFVCTSCKTPITSSYFTKGGFPYCDSPRCRTYPCSASVTVLNLIRERNLHLCSPGGGEVASRRAWQYLYSLGAREGSRIALPLLLRRVEELQRRTHRVHELSEQVPDIKTERPKTGSGSGYETLMCTRK